MANISEEKWIEMLEKKADGSYIAKYPKVKSKSGVTFDEHLADYATLEKAGHIKAETDADGKLILDIPKSNYNATIPPTKNDDESLGYSKGSLWFVDAENINIGYICIDATQGNSIWQMIGSKSELMLYSAGEEFIDRTGGWVQGYTSGGTFEKTTESLHLFGSYGHTVGVVTENVISLDGIDTIFVSWRGTSKHQTSYVTVSPNKEGKALDNVVAVTTKSGAFEQEVSEIDVRGLSGEYYIRIHHSMALQHIIGDTYVYSVFLGSSIR